MIKDYFQIAIKNLTHRKLRTFLTLIGIFVGIAAVVGLISLTQGFNDYLQDEFRNLGADKILIAPKGSSFGASSDSNNPITTKDVEIIRKSTGVQEAGYYKYSVAKIEWGKDDLGFYVVYAYPFDDSRKLIEEVANLKIYKGRRLKNSDSKKVVIGYDYPISKDFNENIGVGDKITINSVEFDVVGVHQKIGNPQDDRSIVMTESDYEDLFGKTDEVSSIMVRVNDGRIPSNVVKNIEKDLRKSRGLKKGEEDFEVTTFEELIQSFLNVFAIIQVVLVGIAGISLIVGGIGIMNTMYTAVVERTKEIGIMKAIGARNEDILIIFLLESGLLGLTGGILGVGLGIGFAKTVEYLGGAQFGTELLQAAIPAWLVIGALAFAFILGTLSGITPARQASKMNPVDALRTE